MAAWVAIVAVLAAPLLVGWHQTAVEHVICAEHGESIHLEAAAQGAGSAIDTHDVSAERGTPGSGSNHHEHCSVSSGVSSEPPRVFARLTTVSVTSTLTLALPASNGLLAVPLLRQAPKTSPPV